MSSTNMIFSRRNLNRSGHRTPRISHFARPPRAKRQRILPRAVALVLLVATYALVSACDNSPTEPCLGPLQVGGEVSAPTKISSPPPIYTNEARQARVQGVVIVQATIDCSGVVTNTRVLQGLPAGLTESTVDAISRWRFNPARRDGTPVSVYYNLSVNFRLQ